MKYLLCIKNVFTKYALVKPLTGEKRKTVLHCFLEAVFESNCKANKFWVDQKREFYNNPIQKWLDHNDILKYPTRNKGKSINDEKFITTLKYKIRKK